MNKFVVSYISFFDNNLYSKIIAADNEMESLKFFFKEEGYGEDFLEGCNSIEEVKNECFNTDCMINTIKVD